MAKASEWATRVQAWRASGKSAKEFCEGREYSAKNLLWWSSHFHRNGITIRASEKSVGLARVVRAPKEPPPRSGSTIVVHVGVVRIEVPAGVDRESLSTVFDALAALAGGPR